MAFANSGNSSDLFKNTSNSLGIDSLSASNSSLQVSTDYANALNINNYFKGSSSYPVIESANLETQFPVNSVTSSNAPFTSGWYTVGSTGKVSFDYLFDGGAYEGELAIFSLEGMGQYKLGSTDFITEAVKRSLSNSTLGHVVISDSDEAARFSGNLNWDANHNLGEYRGLKNFAMRPSDQFGIMQVPNGKVQELLNNPDIEGDKHPLFSLAPNNPLAASQFAQFRDINGSGRIFAMEDLRQDGTSDNDFNDFVFYMEGAEGSAPSLDTLIDKNHDWRSADVGKKISEWNPTPPDSNDKIGRPIPPDNIIKSPDNTIKPPSFQDGDLVKGSDEKVYLIQSSSRRLIPNPGIFQEKGFKKDAIKTLDDKDLNSISLGDNLPIPEQYKESANVANEWRSDFYWWDGNGTPSVDLSNNSNNRFATLNLGDNTRGDGKKGINFDWGAGSPKGDDKLLNDNFAIAAYTQATFDGGTYKFQASGDDGFQVLVKKTGTDELTYLTPKDKWQQAYGLPWEKEITLQGNYGVYFIYYEERGDAKFDLSWEKKIIENPPQPPVKPHKYSFIYSFNGNRDASDYYKEGDYYTGWVVANPGKYVVGEEYDPNPNDNEAGKNGKYYILEDNGEADASDVGKVFVQNYYNSETLTNYQPFNFIQEKPSGIDFLGSEYDFIGSTKSNNNDFGLDKYKYDIQPRDIVVETISPSNGTVVRFDGQVDKFNVDDYYRFYIGSYRADFNLKLNGLSANADVALIFDRNRNGQVEGDEILFTSEQDGSNSELIRRLTSGTYYVRVYSTGSSTDYNLELSAKSVPNIKVEKYTDPNDYIGSVWTTISVEPENEGKKHEVSIDWGNYRWTGTIATNPGQQTVTLVYEKRNKDYLPRVIQVKPLLDPNDFMAVSETSISNGFGSYPGAQKIIDINGSDWKEILPGYELIDIDDAPGIALYKDKNGENFLQSVDLSAGASLKFLHGEKVSEGDSPKFKVQTITEAWNDFSNIEKEKSFSITNGQYFQAQTSLPIIGGFINDSEVSHPLKIDGKIISNGGNKNQAEIQRMLELWNGYADIKDFDKDYFDKSSAPNTLVALEPGRAKPNEFIGRSYIGLKDSDLNGDYETILIFNSSASNDENAVNVLKRFGDNTSFNPNKIIMLDGSGSTQLVAKGELYLEGDNRRIPQTIGVLHG